MKWLLYATNFSVILLALHIKDFIIIQSYPAVAALSYLQIWTAPFEPLKLFAWAALKEIPKWNDVEAVNPDR